MALLGSMAKPLGEKFVRFMNRFSVGRRLTAGIGKVSGTIGGGLNRGFKALDNVGARGKELRQYDWPGDGGGDHTVCRRSEAKGQQHGQCGAQSGQQRIGSIYLERNVWADTT